MHGRSVDDHIDQALTFVRLVAGVCVHMRCLCQDLSLRKMKDCRCCQVGSPRKLVVVCTPAIRIQKKMIRTRPRAVSKSLADVSIQRLAQKQLDDRENGEQIHLLTIMVSDLVHWLVTWYTNDTISGYRRGLPLLNFRPIVEVPPQTYQPRLAGDRCRLVILSLGPPLGPSHAQFLDFCAMLGLHHQRTWVIHFGFMCQRGQLFTMFQWYPIPYRKQGLCQCGKLLHIVGTTASSRLLKRSSLLTQGLGHGWSATVLFVRSDCDGSLMSTFHSSFVSRTVWERNHFQEK